MGWLIAAHASGASIALLLGAYNLLHRPKGDLTHRRVGRIWVVAMYWTVVSSFWIKELHPGHFSWIHGLSVFTFCTLTIGLWAARTGRIKQHRDFMTGSYFGLVGAFLGAVTVPVRAIPQLAVHYPELLAVATAGCATVAAAVIRLCRSGPAEVASPAEPALREVERVRP
ncbi:MAG TPA: DUF2306 domain-containing protein [Jatrophihabitantaceae bacterium]|nr:DUF2306 domain-containing protein [Jatrophihabitantaceae bacterium]